MNVNMLSQTTKAMNGKGFRSVVQRPGASRASRVTLRTRQRRARAVVVFSSDSEGKETVAAVETKEPVEDIKIKSEVVPLMELKITLLKVRFPVNNAYSPFS